MCEKVNIQNLTTQWLVHLVLTLLLCDARKPNVIKYLWLVVHIFNSQIYKFRVEKSLNLQHNSLICSWKCVFLTELEKQIGLSLAVLDAPAKTFRLRKILTNVKSVFPSHLAERLKYSHQFRFSCSWKVHLSGFTLLKNLPVPVSVSL